MQKWPNRDERSAAYQRPGTSWNIPSDSSDGFRDLDHGDIGRLCLCWTALGSQRLLWFLCTSRPNQRRFQGWIASGTAGCAILCCYFVQQGLFPVLSMGKNALQCKDQFMDVRWCKPFEIFQASIHRTMSVYAPFSLCWFCFLHLSAFHLVPFIDSRLVQYGVRSPQARISSPGSCC